MKIDISVSPRVFLNSTANIVPNYAIEIIEKAGNCSGKAYDLMKMESEGYEGERGIIDGEN